MLLWRIMLFVVYEENSIEVPSPGGPFESNMLSKISLFSALDPSSIIILSFCPFCSASMKLFPEISLFFPLIIKNSTDDRKYVKKSVNWALRNIGKRNLVLNKKAIKLSKEILKIESKTAKWIARDAIKELTSAKIQNRLKKNYEKHNKN